MTLWLVALGAGLLAVLATAWWRTRRETAGLRRRLATTADVDAMVAYLRTLPAKE